MRKEKQVVGEMSKTYIGSIAHGGCQPSQLDSGILGCGARFGIGHFGHTDRMDMSMDSDIACQCTPGYRHTQSRVGTLHLELKQGESLLLMLCPSD